MSSDNRNYTNNITNAILKNFKIIIEKSKIKTEL